jgi:hypothetical protein
MEPTQVKPKTNVKDLFLNLGAIVALYTVVISLINLLFAVINTAYPQILNGYNYYGSQSISWPVAILIIFFPIFVLLMWLLEKGYVSEPDRRSMGIRKWLSYITLFLSGLATAGDLATVLYYFIDGQELTTGFLLKVLAVLVIAVAIFYYYISDIRGKLNPSSRKIWAGVATVIIVGSIVWGFSVLGSPRTQRLMKYDEAKINDLMNLNTAIQNYYSINNALPKVPSDLATFNYGISLVDAQNQKPYEYVVKDKTHYDICAEFNIASPDAKSPNVYARPVGYTTWTHSAGRYCFEQVINPSLYPGVKPVM